MVDPPLKLKTNLWFVIEFNLARECKDWTGAIEDAPIMPSDYRTSL